MRPVTPEAYNLFHDGSLVLARIEANGFRIDVKKLLANTEKVSRQIKRIRARMKDSKTFRIWKRAYRDRMVMGSREQLGKILFDVIGHKAKETTATGRAKVSESILNEIDDPFVKDFIEIEKLKKLKSTYLEGVLKNTQDGFCHPFFNLHNVRTYRSSSDSPNFQNIPIRNKDIGKMIRTCFISRRPDSRIVELDFSGAEVRVAACYHKDPTMLKYLADPSKDMHRDMAEQCLKLSRDEVTKQARGLIKGAFVFAQFYGDYFVNCARNIWEGLEREKITTAAGVPILDHLREKGIMRMGACVPGERTKPGTFEAHIRSVEKDFWGRRFKKYDQWRRLWYNDYLDNGGFKTLTGFYIDGPLRKNEVINFPVQGSAFHCLLWSLVKLQKEMDRAGMKSVLIGQIHDSIIADVLESEFETYIQMAREITTEKLPKAWPWIITGMEIEIEAAPPGGSWFEKKEV